MNAPSAWHRSTVTREKLSTPYDYEIIERLHVSARSRVYRALSLRGQVPLIVKILNNDFPSFREVVQFKREHAIAQRCQHPGVVRPLALLQEAGRWVMVQEDIGGQSLDQVLASAGSAAGPAIALADFFEIALQLCAALDAVHGHAVIHKDINPSNLVWNGAQRRLQLIDFGIACELGQEIQGLANPSTLEGTLPYMAPEQTGRMNRVVDYRADYYALGATLYELLTGQPPFAGIDAMTLVHCHIARAPDWSLPALANLPGPLLEVVQRLLEKNAEQRYQSLHGLKNDLTLCRALMRSPAPAWSHSLSTGLLDHSGKFLIPQTLYGREAEVEVLLSAFARISGGPSEMLLITGYSGIGKSALVNEVHKPIVARRGYFVSGKFDQYRRNVPYASLIQAFGQLILQLLGEPEQQVRAWGAKLRAALGVNLGVIAELIPELWLLVGATEPAASLPPFESENRLHRLFQRFVRVFSAPDHPLVMFLDDLQWADAATLKMIELFMRDPGKRYMLFIGAYRASDVDDGHPLTALRERLQRSNVRLSALTLMPLSAQHVGQLLADTLCMPAADCTPLTYLCHEKTRGNPFFLNQFLQAIHAAGHLRYQFDQGGWRWDMDALESADYTDNVGDLMSEKILRLPPATRQLLQLAAAIGNRFALTTLAVVGEQSFYQTQENLWPALEAGLIHPLDPDYKYLGEEEIETDIAYRFLHDRVQQAAYAVADVRSRQENHLTIGRLLYCHATAHTLDDQLFAIVEQLNAGRAWIEHPDERLRLARLNQRAGVKARSAAAFQAAQRHMGIGLALLPQQAWLDHGELWFDLQLGAAEAAYLCGQFDAAEAIYPLVMMHCDNALQKIRCITIQSRQYQLQGRLQDAIAVLLGGLALLQIAIPHDDAALQAAIPAMFADTERCRAGRTMDDLLGAPAMADPASVCAMQMMQGVFLAAYYCDRQHLVDVMLLSMTRLSLEQGNSDFTSVAYVGYASFFAIDGHGLERSYQFGAMAHDLVNRSHHVQPRTLTCLMFAALINHWTRRLSSSVSIYDEAFDWALESGDFVHVGVLAAFRASDGLILGQYLPDLLQATERDLALMRTHGHGQDDLSDCIIAGAVQPIKCLMGLTARGDSYDDERFSEARFLAEYGASSLYRAYFYQGKIRNAYLFDAADAEALAGQLDLVLQILRGQAKVPETTFYVALILLRLLRRDPQRADAGALLARCAIFQARFAIWAEQAPDNFGAQHWLLQAEAARQRQDLGLAVRHYGLALDAARASGCVHLQALSNELYGELWLEQGQRRIAEPFLQDAIAHYRQWGADGKAAQLSARHASIVGAGFASGVSHRQASGAEPVTSGSAEQANAALDLASILKASHALSNEIGLCNVLRRLIAIVCENSGAQVARLLLLSADGWRLEAENAGDALAVPRALALDADADPQFPLSLLRYVARTGVEIIEDHIVSSARFAQDPYVQMQQPKSVMCLPIRQAGQISGMLYLENNLARASFTFERVEFLRMLGAQAMISIAHARLHDDLEQRVAERTAQLEDANRKLATLSATDALTGLANRRHFDATLRNEWSRARRTLQPLAVIMIAVDNFKKYNDCYGHQAGDACLKSIARVLQAGARRVSDLVARHDGAGFAIVLPDTDAVVVQSLADAMCAQIELLALPHQLALTGKVTISAGVAFKLAGSEDSAAALVRAADEALYRAKRAGLRGANRDPGARCPAQAACDGTALTPIAPGFWVK
jgi:diguanylate cyclase (GGDEF)-like protein